MYRLFCPKKIFFNICVLSQCIVYWIHLQNKHTFSHQKTLLHTLCCCLFFKLSKAFSVSLMVDNLLIRNYITQLFLVIVADSQDNHDHCNRLAYIIFVYVKLRLDFCKCSKKRLEKYDNYWVSEETTWRVDRNSSSICKWNKLEQNMKY